MNSTISPSPAADAAAAETLLFVAGVNNIDTLARRLWSSPCLHSGRWPLVAHFNAVSAADAFNSVIDSAAYRSQARWLVWVHQDVVLPQGWDVQFQAAIAQARPLFPHLAVVGIYGVEGRGPAARRVGHVIDRGALLREPPALPSAADSLDELLFAVRMDSGLRLDAALGFDFYATDLALQARERGLQTAVVNACCEHWSSTPALPPFPGRTVERVRASAQVFEHKWQHALPVNTPCFDITRTGDVERFLALVEGRHPPP